MSFPSQQLAAYLIAPGNVELRHVAIPQPGDGQALLRVDRALAGGTDRKAFARGHPMIPMPGPFGHRYAGTVAALGRGAPAFEIGQRVMGVHSAPCLQCPACRSGRSNLCADVMQEKVLGAFGQYLCIPAAVAKHSLFPCPDWLDAEYAALQEPVACVVHGLELIDWRSVERVLVLGLGVMGLLFAQLLPRYTKAGCAGAGRRARRLELGRCFGLRPVWDVDADPIPPEERFDCVIECTGQLDGWKEAFERAAPGGQVLLFGGVPRGTQIPLDTFRLHYEEIRVLGSFHFRPYDVAKARDFLLSTSLELDSLISGCLPLAQLAEALRRLEASEGLQYAIDPWTA